jgi:hypothetical protein
MSSRDRAARGWLALVVLGMILFQGCQTREIGSGAQQAPMSQGGALIFSDDLSSGSLAEHWKRGKGEGGPGQWTVVDGWIQGQRLRNDPLWLQIPLPEKVRIEFEAMAMTSVGDIKVEVFGNGEDHESGYVLIYGGWNNSLDVIARLDEHGKDRRERPSRKVTPEQVYAMAVERIDGTVRWFVDGELFMHYEDASPLRGELHRFFALSNWDAVVRFRGVRVYELP